MQERAGVCQVHTARNPNASGMQVQPSAWERTPHTAMGTPTPSRAHIPQGRWEICSDATQERALHRQHLASSQFLAFTIHWAHGLGPWGARGVLWEPQGCPGVVTLPPPLGLTDTQLTEPGAPSRCGVRWGPAFCWVPGGRQKEPWYLPLPGDSTPSTRLHPSSYALLPRASPPGHQCQNQFYATICFKYGPNKFTLAT